MYKYFLFVLLLSVSFQLQAQDATIKALKSEVEKPIKKDAGDTLMIPWKKGGLFNFNVNQGSLSNWAAGGDKFSFSMNAYLNLFAFYKKGRHSWDNSLDLAYGIVQTTSLGRRKASDRIEFTSKYGNAISKKLNLTGLFNLRTQFADGFSYEKDATGIERANLISRPFSPAFILFSPGVDYKPADYLSIFLSPVTGRWVVVTDPILNNKYGVPEGNKVKDELGAFLSINFRKKFNNNFEYKSKMDLFSNYKNNPQNIDIFWTNVLSAKITKYINFNLNVDMIYDDDTKNVVPGKGPASQWLQLMGIGFAYNFKSY
jgi:hypothetical protein